VKKKIKIYLILLKKYKIMKKNFKKYFPHIVSALIIFTPFFLFAADTTIKNPLKSDSVTGILGEIMKLVATVGSVVVVFFIIFSGFKFVTARGNPAELENAKKMFFATIIGGAILLGASVIASVVVKTVEDTVKLK
jgi:hypothetical protein